MIAALSALWGARQYAIGAAAGFVALSLVNALWWLPAARNEGRELERAAALKRTIELIQQRGRTNAEINALSPAALCSELGGVFENNECR